MEIPHTEMLRAAVRIKVDALGHGSVSINGVEMANVVSGISFETTVDERTQVMLQIRPEQVELESEDIAGVIRWLTPAEPKPLEHDFPEVVEDGIGAEWKPLRVCKRCRQVHGRHAPVCPGPIR